MHSFRNVNGAEKACFLYFVDMRSDAFLFMNYVAPIDSGDIAMDYEKNLEIKLSTDFKIKVARLANQKRVFQTHPITILRI